MSIPEIISKKLDANDIQYQTIPLTKAMGIMQSAEALDDERSKLIRIVAIKSASKTLICVLPFDFLLDMKLIWDSFDDEFNVLNREQTLVCFNDCDELSLAAIPFTSSYDYLVDSSILDMPEVILQSGAADILIKLDKINANLLFQECRSLTFASNTKELFSGRDKATKAKQVEDNFTSIRLKQRISETFDLPAMPQIAKDIMKLRVDPSANAEKLAKIVCQDPSLAAQVISWSSSPYYGYQGKVDSVETAIARVLGFELVMNLALGISIGKSLRAPMDGILGVREFWKQAIYSANLTEKLCQAMPIKQRPERGLIYLSGLLHNFGHLLLGHIFPPQFKLVNVTVEANPYISVEDIEYYILGVTHEELGAWLMHNWHMPDELIVAVNYHHQEQFWSKHAVYSNLVLVANRMLKRLDIGDSVETEIPQSTLDLLSLNENIIEAALAEIQDESEALDVIAKQLVA